MGLSGISFWELLFILAIIVLLFGTKKLRTLGSDLGTAVKGFKDALNSNEASNDNRTITGSKTEESGKATSQTTEKPSE